MKHDHVLLVGRLGEKRQALSAGWDEGDIYTPPFFTLEGRKYKTALITWDGAANLDYWDRDRLERDQIRMTTEIRIGPLTPPPAEE